MKFPCFYIACLTMLSLATQCLANSHSDDKNIERKFYLRADLGISAPIPYPNKEYYFGQKLSKSGFYGIGVGYTFNSTLRSDITVTKRNKFKFSYTLTRMNSKSVATQNFSNTSLMFNTYYDFPSPIPVNPYINLGVGLAYNQTHDYHWNIPKINFTTYANPTGKFNIAWSIGGGIRAKLSDAIFCDINYKYISLGKFKKTHYYASNNNQVDVITPATLRNHEIGIGFGYMF